MKNITLLTNIFALTLLFSGSVYSQNKPGKPELLVVKFHADWCGSCRALGPVLTDLTNVHDGDPVLFVKLDFTNNSVKHQSNLLAASLGIADIVKDNHGTGFLLLVDNKTMKVKATFTKTQTLKEMSKQITTAL